VSFSSDPSSRNFTLGQTQGKLILRLRTTRTDLNGTNPELELCSVEANRTYHLAVTYAGGKVLCYLDGAKVLDSAAVQGTSATGRRTSGVRRRMERRAQLVGTLEGIAVFSRALNADQVMREYQAYQRIRSRRPTVAALAVNAELVKLSKVPTLKEFFRTAKRWWWRSTG